MVATPEIRASQGYLQSVSFGDSALQISQAYALGVANFPTDFIQASEGLVQTVWSGDGFVQASQAYVRVVARGRIENPRLNAWKFKLDNHEFYVLRLGENKTLVFDMLTRQWSWWGSPLRNTWRANTGFNWKTPGTSAFLFGSNVVCGDDNTGVLWILDPEQGYDDSPIVSDETPQKFFRKATAQVISRGRAFIPVYDLYLTASPSAPAYPSAEVSLKYSDNGGQTFVNAGNIPVQFNNYVQEYAWRSLGRIQAPGRIFQIEDDGAFARIDGLDMNTTVEG